MDFTTVDFETLEKKLATMLTPARYQHSLGVMETAEKMAKRFGVDVIKARIAGLLHDCAKNIDKDEMVRLCDEKGIELDPVKREQRGLIHADLGASMLPEEFGISDPDIMDAVKYHTLGRENMTDLEKILYLADIVEPGRKPFDGMEDLRRLCECDLDCAMLFAIERAIDYVLHRRKKIHSQTLETQQYFITLCKGR